MSIRFKSSLHKKAVQALNKKQFKNTMKKNVNNHNNNNNNKNNINNSNSNSKNNSNVSINSNNTAATQKMNMTVNDDILKENQEETVLNGSIENESIESENESSINSDDTSEILNSKSNEEEMVEPMTEVQQAQPHPSIIHQGHLHEFAPRIVVVGVGGGGGNAVNNMIANQLSGVDFLALNTDAQHLSTILTDNKLQIGSTLTSGLGCGANPDAGRLAAEESKEQISEILSDAHMVFITAGMGGGTGTGAAPVVAELCYNLGILTVGVITKPFRFEGTHRMRLANEGIDRMEKVVDTMIVIPNQNLFAMANDQTSFMDAFGMADNVLLAGVKSITDLMTTPGLINLDFADVQSVMHGMGNAILGTGVSSSSQLTTDADGQVTERAILAAEQALANPLLGDNMDIGTAKGMLVNITGGKDMTLFEVDRAAQCITERIQDESANIIFGSAYDESLDGSIRVSVVATGIEERTIS
jgi:cell division protein FtsZ